MIKESLPIFLMLATSTFLAIWLEQRYRTFKKLGAAPLVILIGMGLSNTGIIPGESAAYDFLMSSGVSAGIVLILLGIDLDSIRKAGGSMLKAFGIGALGSMIGSMVMALLLFGFFGEETWKLAGQFTGTYIGGGMNFAALAQAFGTDNDIFTAAIAADVIVTALWLLVCLTAPVFLARKAEKTIQNPAEISQPGFNIGKALYRSKDHLHIRDLAALASVTFAALWVAGILHNSVPVVPTVIWLTLVALILAQVPSVKNLQGGTMIGHYFILLFLASNGAKSIVSNIIDVGPAVFYFAIGTVTIHGLVIFGLGWLARIDAGTLAVASQANVGGSGSALALASARGYGDKILPGIAAGLLGYAVGNFLGVGVGNLMKYFL